jgi:hypothetical protein
MKNRLVLIAALTLLTAMTGCALRLSMEVKNPFHPDTQQPYGTAKPNSQPTR